MAIFAWHGIGLEIPSRCSPITLEGDFARGYVLIADMTRPRLGIRWNTPWAAKVDPEKLLRTAMVQEVGVLAADESIAHPAGEMGIGLLYSEPAPPGRDVWIGWSPSTGRVVQIIHHARHRERILLDKILPSLTDAGGKDVLPWSVFDLSCRIPREYELKSNQLNVGDLSLSFSAKFHRLRVRQIAIATVALRRRALEKWLGAELRLEKRYYRQDGETLMLSEGKIGKTVSRRRRFFFAWTLPRTMTAIAAHDVERDKLIIVQGTDVELVREVVESVGWAAEVDTGVNRGTC
jgi:hypothetical protein